MTDEPWLTTEDVAKRFKLKTATIAKWRQNGKGPRWSVLEGSVRYNINDIEQYESENNGRSE